MSLEVEEETMSYPASSATRFRRKDLNLSGWFSIAHLIVSRTSRSRSCGVLGMCARERWGSDPRRTENEGIAELIQSSS
jgi:hypothetical protein